MKKIFVLATVCCLMGCAQTATTSNSSLTTCLTQKSYTALTDGTLANSSVSVLAKEIATSCLKSLALEKAGLDTEAQTATTSLLTALKGNLTK